MLLVDLIRRRRSELGARGRPLSYQTIASRCGLPVSTVHVLASRGVRRVDGVVLHRLHMLADALELPRGRVEKAVLSELGFTSVDREHGLSEREEWLVDALRRLDAHDVEIVVSLVQIMLTQRTR